MDLHLNGLLKDAWVVKPRTTYNGNVRLTNTTKLLSLTSPEDRPSPDSLINLTPSP